MRIKLNIIAIFYLLFKMICLTLLMNNIKTNDVILDLKGLIDTLPELFETKKYACYTENESDHNFIANSDKNSILNRIYHQKRKEMDKVCFVDSLLSENQEFSISQFEETKTFFVMNEIPLRLTMSFISNYKEIEIIYINSILDYELLLAHYLSPKLNKSLKIKLLNKIVQHFETGLYSEAYYLVGQELIKQTKTNSFYSSVNQIKDAFTKIDTLKLDYFENLIVYLFIILLIILVVFIIHRSLNHLLKILRLLKTLLIYYKAKSMIEFIKIILIFKKRILKI